MRGGRREVEAMEVVLDRGKIAPHDSKQYVALEFLNFTNPVQRKDAVHRKKVRKHAISRPGLKTWSGKQLFLGVYVRLSREKKRGAGSSS